MKLRHLVAGTAAALMMAGGVSVAVAPAASADTISITTNCDAPISLVANPGDTIAFTMGPNCAGGAGHWAIWTNRLADAVGFARAAGWLHIVSATGAAGAVFGSGGDTEAIYVQPGAVVTTELLAETIDAEPLFVGAQTAVIWDQSTNPNFVFFPITYAGPRDTYVPPPSWYQAVGRASADAVCADGWRASWAEWPNGGTGGFVCEREEYYNVAAAAWAFRSKATIGR